MTRKYQILTEEQIEEIREKYRSGKYSQGQLAMQYGTARSNIHNIIFRRSKND